MLLLIGNRFEIEIRRYYVYLELGSHQWFIALNTDEEYGWYIDRGCGHSPWFLRASSR